MKNVYSLKKLCLILLLFSGQAFCFSEDEVKAAFIYNFTKFVSWPSEKSDQLVLCILGAAKSKEPYMALENKGNLAVREINTINSAQECSILYKKGSGMSTRELSNYSVQNSILLVGDGDSFINENGMIGLVENEGKITFEVNHLKIKEARLKVSSKLMALAKRVVSD